MSEVPEVWNQIEDRLEARSDDFSLINIEKLRKFFLDNFDEIEFRNEIIRLDSMSVRNFKAIGRTELVQFDERATYLYGPNSKGKTSLVRAIQFNIAGIPDGDEDAYGMRKLVYEQSDRLSTSGFWYFDSSPFTVERNLVQSGRGKRRTEYNEPFLRQGFIDENQSLTERMEDPEAHIGEEKITSDELLKHFGLYELNDRGHSPFDVLSLFFLMGEDFKRFLGSNSQLIDLLFGINVTEVFEGIEDRIKELELSQEEEYAESNLERFKGEKKSIQNEIQQLENERERELNRLVQLQDRLESIEGILSGDDEAKEFESRLDELRGRRADLKVRLEETVDELGQLKRLIERYDSTELHQDLSGIADDLRNLMTVPDKCPICVNDVDSEQRSRLVNDGCCPLCAKDMPEERMRVEFEHQTPDSLTEDEFSLQEDVQEYREKKRKLEGEKNYLQSQIEDVEEEIEKVSQRLEGSETKELTEEKSTIREEIDQLRKDIFEKESKIEDLEEDLERVEYEIKAQWRLIPIAKIKDRERKVFERFRPIIREERKKRREELKRELETEIEHLLGVFEYGTFSDAHNPSFDEGDTYHFTLQSSERELNSRTPDPSTAEINIHAFLFHTALLRKLSSSINSLPLRVFAIDSPFTNEIDEDNEKDISTFLMELPELLPNYQIIITSADTEGFKSSKYADNYSMKRYPDSGQSDLANFDN